MSDATRLYEISLDQDNISIHAPHERCDESNGWMVGRTKIFQSTHRMSDATVDKKLKDV